MSLNQDSNFELLCGGGKSFGIDKFFVILLLPEEKNALDEDFSRVFSNISVNHY